jgi:PQQ-dependent catabolism-associated CXXCW motif protein
MKAFARTALAFAALLAVLPMTAAVAQDSLADVRSDLIAPWLLTVTGEARARVLRVKEVAQDTEGSFLIDATLGWADGVQSLVRVEFIHSGPKRGLIVRTQGGSLYSLFRTPEGHFAGAFKPARGPEREAKAEKVTEDRLLQIAKDQQARLAARSFADEDRDWGVPPTAQLRTGRMHAPTPREIPGGRTIRTLEVRAMQSQSPAPVLVDALDGSGHRTIPGAHWISGAGEGAGNAASERLRADLEKLTAGDKAVSLVFFCLSAECWLSYNAALRAIGLGYTNVHWFRGGTEAWRRAGFETREAVPFRR